jgi:transposase
MSALEETETLAALFLLPDSIAVETVYPTKSRLTLQISCTLKSASCPLCQQSSERIHARYGRTVADVPCGGRLVTLALTVRKFVCSTKACPRRIFTERLPDLVQSYARMTNRLSEALQTLGFATCGQLGERFAPKLGMQVSGPTLLRRMRTCSYTPPASVSVLGIDDWAWKKGATYGTILVEIARRLKLSRETIRRFLRAEEFPEMASARRGQRGSILNQYKPYIFQRWQQGCRNSVQLYDEIKTRGYAGSTSLLRNFLASLRKKHVEAGSAEVLTFDASTQTIEIPDSLPPKPCVTRRLSSTRASWLFVSKLEKLDEKQRKDIEQIRQGHPALRDGLSIRARICHDVGRTPRHGSGRLADPSGTQRPA